MNILENQNIAVSSFDIKGKRDNSYFLATLYIIYDKNSLQIEYFYYEVKKAQMILSNNINSINSNDKKNREEFIKIFELNDKQNIELEYEHLKELAEKSTTYFYSLDSIFKFIFGETLKKSWTRMTNPYNMYLVNKKNQNGYFNVWYGKFKDSYYWLFQLMSEELKAYKCNNILEDLTCGDFKKYYDKNKSDDSNYFKLYDSLSFKEKLDKISLFSKKSNQDNRFDFSICEKKDQNTNDYTFDAKRLRDFIHSVKDKLLHESYNNNWLTEEQYKNYKIETRCEEQNRLLFDVVIKKYLEESKRNIDITNLRNKLERLILIESQSQSLNSREINNIRKMENKNFHCPISWTKNDKNIIYYGVPGTGKTHCSKELANWIINNKWKEQYNSRFNNKIEQFEKDYIDEDNQDEDNQIEIITFHQNYGYEDFIEGIKPVLVNGHNEDKYSKSLNNQFGSVLQFKLKKGILRNIVDKAMKNHHKNYVLIIDEINRGNVSQIFGECFTLIESSKRLRNDCDNIQCLGGDKCKGKWDGNWKVTLPTSEEKFGIPDNLYIIGTMNDNDHSIAHFDFAFRRRFVFVEKKPSEDFISNYYAKDVFVKLNKEIESKFSLNKQIGHSYFMKVKKNIDNKKSKEKIKEILSKEIWPLLKSDIDLNTNDIKIIEKNINEFVENYNSK